MIHIIVPLDGSRLAEAAVGHAAAIAKVYSAKISLLRIVTGTQSESGTPLDSVDWRLHRRQVEAYLEGVAERLRASGLSVDCVVEEGKAAESICRIAVAQRADLIVLSRFGRGGISEFGAGSTALKVVARSPASVLLVGPKAVEAAADEVGVNYRRILVPVDSSLNAEWALGLGAMIAQSHDAELHIVYVVEEPDISSRIAVTRDLHDVVDRMRRFLRLEAMRRTEELKAQFPATAKVHSNVVTARDVASALHAESEKNDVDLIVISAHSTGGECQWRYGSVCEALLTHTMRPVLVLQQARAARRQPFRSVHLAEPRVDVG